MPYYLTKNDTMFNGYKDKSGIPNIYYKKSEEALSFHIGIELAIDSLRKTGKKIVCSICRQNITVEKELERVITSPKCGKRRKRICDEPYAVYRNKRFVLQPVSPQQRV